MMVDELLSILKSTNFDFEIFQRKLRIKNQCFQLLCRQMDALLKSARLSLEATNFGTLGSFI